MDQHPIQGGVAILLVASCYGNRDKLWPDGPVGSYTDLTMSFVKLFLLILSRGETSSEWSCDMLCLESEVYVTFGVYKS